MEVRSFDVKAKAKKLVGYALKFGELGKIINQRGEIEYERISKDALKNANFDDVILNINHDDNLQVASTRERSLSLSVDDIGLKFEANIGNDELSNQAYDMVKRGYADQASFRAEFLKRRQVYEDGVPVFLVEELGRFEDVSIVDIPAYKSAEIQARSKGVERMENKETVVKEETKTEETQPTKSTEEKKVDEEVVEETANEVKEDIKENAEENKIDYDLLAEKVAEKLQPKEETKTEEKKEEEVGERSMQNVQKDMLDVNTMKAKNVDVRSTAEYKAVWAEAIKKDDMSIAENFIAERSIATNGSNGEKSLVPTELQDFIETQLREGGRVASLCNIKSIAGLYKVPVELSATDAVIHEEGSEAPAEEEITFGEVLIDADYLKKWISVTDKMLAMTNIDLANYLIDELKNKILELLDELVISGTGVVKGITTIADENFVKQVDATEINTAGYLAQGAVKTTGTVEVVMNRSFYYSVIATATDATGRPLAVESIVNGKVVPMFNGMKVTFANSKTLADTLSDSKPAMIVGDFKGYFLNCPEGANVIVKMDDKTEMRKNLVIFLGKLLAGGNVTKQNSFAVVNVTGLPS